MRKYAIVMLSAILIFLFLNYIFVYEVNNIQVEKIEIENDKLPSELRNKTIVFLTDIHSTTYTEKMRKVSVIVDEINPDYILLGGDYVDKDFSSLEGLEYFIGELKKPNRKVFAVLGNHEHWYSTPERITVMFARNNVILLNNEHAELCDNSSCFTIIGVDDPYTGYDDLNKAMRGVDYSQYRILLAHSPDVIDKINSHQADLILAGHTHGGQVNIPILRSLWIPSKYGEKYTNGMFEINGDELYVSRGIGEAYGIRFLCPPEITIIKFI